MKTGNTVLKGFRLILLVSALGFLFVGSVSAADPIQFDHNGHWYESAPTGHTWTQARDYAAGRTFEDPDTGVVLQGHLVTIQDQAEYDFIRTSFIAGQWQQMWIGAFRFAEDGDPEDNWAWVTGEAWDYTNWDSENSQPQPVEDGENYVRMLNFFPGGWHDFPDVAGNPLYLFTVIEYEEPISYSCAGFEPPLNRVVSVNKNRRLPLKMVLFDADGRKVIDLDEAPVIVIDFDGDEIDYGRQFVRKGRRWRYNLRTKDINTGPGVYTIRAESGNPDSYTIEPTCHAVFVIK